MEDKEIQTDSLKFENSIDTPQDTSITSEILRELTECLKIYNSDLGASALNDKEVILLVKQKHIPLYQIEKAVNDPERGVGIRRQIVGMDGNFVAALVGLPFKNYDYTKVGNQFQNILR